MIRRAVVAGQFYAAEEIELKKQIKDCFMHNLGPRRLPEKMLEISKKPRIKAIISPHAGYPFSGPCAANSYLEIAESLKSDTYIIIGPNHTGLGSSGISGMDYSTPFGIIQTDKKLSKIISDTTGLLIDEQTHMLEHSVEVQLPFLQFALDERIENTKIVAIVLGDDIDSSRFGKDLAVAIRESGKSITIITSSDLSHIGERFDYMPFDVPTKDRVHSLDMEAIDRILDTDIEGFKTYMGKTKSTVCGRNPIIALLSALQEISKKDRIGEKKLLSYYTSGDMTDDYSHTVGYASVLFR